MINTLIQAYALGCLSRKETDLVRKNIESNPELNIKDLGKYQNLTSLLPLALPVEIPDQHIKEKIARRLYRLKNEEVLKKEEPGELYKSTPSKDIAKDIITKSTSETGSDKYVRITGQTPKAVSGEIKKTGEKMSRDFGDIKLTSTHLLRPVRTSTIFLIAGAALLAGILLGYIFFYENTSAYKDEIAKLSSQVDELNTGLAVNNNLLSLLEKKDTRVFRLSGSDIHPDGYGRVYINNSSSKAYLYLAGIPTAPEGSKYQLWIINSGTVFPIGLFNPTGGSGYFYFTFPQINTRSNLLFLLTEEPERGSDKPGKRIYLTSSD